MLFTPQAPNKQSTKLKILIYYVIFVNNNLLKQHGSFKIVSTVNCTFL